MKTQISNLINGGGHVKRMPDAEKYINAKGADTPAGIAGTNMEERLAVGSMVLEERLAVGSMVLEENGETMRALVCGEEVAMRLSRSCSGAT